ncbi:MAG: prolipoprotein diacylglyceryl transferase [Bacteroidetes bacterium]|jgi:phosphatidylglycerol:prolipoprotein diacylglycerol transferase|nr:prolipoprotein diacylglyceryl transferase [Bacteroidota bacterium]
MYPRLSDLVQDLFGVTAPFPIYSFGAMVAVAALVGAWLTGRELDRLYRAGRIEGVDMVDTDAPSDAPRTVRVSPSILVSTGLLLTIVLGIAGAKVFHVLEHVGAFLDDPVGMLFTSGGLTFYGGFLVAGLGVAYYVHRNGLSVPTFADACAPGLMMGYGIGRIGCHLAGDGDWGVAADLTLKPDIIPMWLWAETYPNNILGVSLPEPGVYPTPLYEFAMASVLLFAVLWVARRHPFRSGWLFSLYLVLAGGERLLIEQIRVNVTFDLFGVMATQAEVISVGLMVAGAVGLWLTTKERVPLNPSEAWPVNAGSANVSSST